MALTRRDFLRRTAARGAIAALARPAQSATLIGTPGAPTAIDTHTHFYDPSRPQGVPWPNKSETLLYKPYLPEQFRSLTTPMGVAGTVVVEASPWLEDNQWALDLAARHPGIVGFIGHLEPGQPEFAGRLRRFSANPLFRGIRLNAAAIAKGIGQRSFENDLRRLADRRLALDVLGGAAMLPDVVKLAKLAPALRIVIDHLPFGEWDRDVQAARRALTEIAGQPNVYAKVSGVVRRVDGRIVEDAEFYRPGLDLLWELFGAGRLLFGSNWPVSERIAPYAVALQVAAAYFTARGPAAAEKFFWKNSLAAYRWLPRGEARRLLK